MASEFSTATGFLAPEDKGGPRAGIGARAIVSRVGDGAVTIQLRRGDGGTPTETYPTELRSRAVMLTDGVEQTLTLATMDLDLADFTERGYELVIIGDGGADITVSDPLIVTEPSTTAGT